MKMCVSAIIALACLNACSNTAPLNTSAAPVLAKSISAEQAKAKERRKKEESLANFRAEAGKSPKEYVKTINRHMRENLPDPRSTYDLSISKPVFGMYNYESFDGNYGWVNESYGWLVSVKYNTKNTSGGYKGLTEYLYIFHGEKQILNGPKKRSL